MSLEQWFSLVNIASTVLIVPLAASYWKMQERLSRIEGALEIIVKKVA